MKVIIIKEKKKTEESKQNKTKKDNSSELQNPYVDAEIYNNKSVTECAHIHIQL